MKKSNKTSVFYILSSVLLLGAMLFGGIYGIYISVGLNFVRSSVANISDVGAGNSGATNVAFGGTVNFESSMTGIIILSVILVILAILDIISLIKQIVLFKQYKMVRNARFEKVIEKKVKSKSAVVFFAIVVDILSLIVGVVGIFLNARTFVGSNLSWVLYLIDGLVALLSVISLVLLIIKVKQVKNNNLNNEHDAKNESLEENNNFVQKNFDIDNIEYSLLKLKYLKSSKIITAEESEILRNKILRKDDFENNKNLK